ncbi:DUF4405 domain-containing protein [Ruminococcus flavefaciens]|uniref:DUF4405 domain-containing protein n=1 Tax=Ruminococcus flavefaciens TaxID=1265 RepID=UPI0004921BC6|nr:DUF4405 domain-containing protein [Ruminococcus flavefaciens]
MQDKHENNDLNDILSAFKSTASDDGNSSGQKMSSEEAAAKVEEMFAQARAQSASKKKKHGSSSDEETPDPFELPDINSEPYETEEKSTGIFTGTREKKESAKTRDERLQSDVAALSSELTDGKLSSEEAEKKITEMLTLASAHNNDKPQKSRYSVKTMEVIVLTVVAVIFFAITMDSGLPGPLSPVAILLPALFGIGYRYFKQQLPIRKAVSESIPHIIISAVFMIGVILAFI